MSDWHSNCDCFYILLLLPPSKHLPSSCSICESSYIQMTIAPAELQLPQPHKDWNSLKRNAGRRDFPLHLFLILTAHSLPLLSVKGTSSAVTKVAFSFPCFDKWPAFLFQNKTVHHKAEAINGDDCIDSQEKRLYKFSLRSQIGPEALCWFYAKEKNNSWKQKWNGESETERRWWWEEGGTKPLEELVLESGEAQMRYTETGRQNKRPWNEDRKQCWVTERQREKLRKGGYLQHPSCEA